MENHEWNKELMRAAKRAASFQENEASLGTRKIAPLSELKVAAISEDVFLQDLTILQTLLMEAPVQLPKDREYVAMLKEGKLHLYGKKEGIDSFEILADGKGSLQAIRQVPSGTSMTVLANAKTYEIILHRDAIEETSTSQSTKESSGSRYSSPAEDRYAAQETSRQTTPWRAQRTPERPAYSYPSSSHYESRSSYSSGER